MDTQVTSIVVSSTVVDYVHHDPYLRLNGLDPKDVHRYSEVKRSLYSALSEGDEGELSIAIPPHLITQIEKSLGEGTEAIPVDQITVIEKMSFVVRIDYSVRDPPNGLEFVLPSENYPYRVPHMYTTLSGPDAARCWVPCVDNMWERCTWDLEFVVPRYLTNHHEAEDPNTSDANDYPVVVVASGELVEQVSHPYNSSKTIFLFSQAVPTSVQHIAFAAGPFHVHELPADQSPPDPDKEDDEEYVQPDMHVFCLPGLEPMLRTSTSFYRSAMKFYSTLGSYPFGSFKAVFVDDLPRQRLDSATLALISNDVLYGDDAIEQVYESRQTLSHALACQWVGINILPKSWSDLWLVSGLGSFITALFFRQMFGNNDYRFRLRRDMDRIAELDVGTQLPICQPTVLEPPDPSTLSFINLKAPVVLYILDRHLGKSGTSHGLSRVIPKIFLSAISGDLIGNTLSTSSFLRTCRKISGVDPRIFAEQWIYGSGCPQFTFNASFNRKKLIVEFMMRQVSPAFEANKHDPIALGILRPVPFFEGTITVRIHEPDGTPYEHVLDIRSPQKHYEVLFNTKYKRVRRNTKRYISRKAAAMAAAAGDQEAAEDIGLLDETFGHGLWEDEAERARWRVADWTEEDEQRMASATYEWIRMDADSEWIGDISFEQPDFMWVSQLQRDRDVIAQLEALRALARAPSTIVSSFLTHTVLVQNYFFRVRMEAAMLLIRCAIAELNYIGIFHLLKIFTAYCFQPQQKKHEFSTRFIPRPNDFSNVPDYFVRKSLIASLAHFRNSAEMDYVVPRFLIDQLRYNDNTSNLYSDGLYISTLIAAIGASLLPTVTPEQSQLIAITQAPIERTQAAELLRDATVEVDRYREMDRLVPSAHNVVSIAAIEWNMMLMMGNMIPNDCSLFLRYSREGNYIGVRLAAFDGLMLMKWYTSKNLIRYVIGVIMADPSRLVRQHVARGVLESFAILFSIGDIPWLGSKAQDILIEEDSNGPLTEKKNPRKKELETMAKSLRSYAGKSQSMREGVMPILLGMETDPQVRMCILKMCELLFHGTDEATPALKIHLPPTPMADITPAGPPELPAPQTAPSQLKIKTIQRRPTLPIVLPLVSAPSSPVVTLPRLKLTTGRLQDARASFPDSALMPPPPVPDHALERAQPPEKKDKALSRGQTAGMNRPDLRICRNTMKKLISHKSSGIFQQPVDPVREQAPDYFARIKHPMDLSTMSAKLEGGTYPDRFAFEADFRLMINNAKSYNPPKTFHHAQAVAFDGFFTAQWDKATRALQTAETKAGHTSTLAQPDDMAQAALALEGDSAADPERVAQEAADALSALAQPSTSGSPAPHSTDPQFTAVTKPLKLRLSSSTSTDKKKSNANGHVPVVDASNSRSSPAPKRPRQNSANEKAPNISHSPAPHSSEEDILFAELDAIEAEKKGTPSPAKKSKPKERAPEPEPELDLLLGGALDRVVAKEDPMPELERPATVPRSSSSSLAADKPDKKSLSTSSLPLKLKMKQKDSSPLPASDRTPIDLNKCKSIIGKLRKDTFNAIYFLQPVDAVALQCPTYYVEIKHPMDLSTLESSLLSSTYKTMEHFEHDLRLIFQNCRQFNPPETDVYRAADNLEALYNKEWAKVMEKKLSSADRAFALKTLTNLLNDPASFFFRVPVDPDAHGVPTYFTVVDPADARDLRTIKQNVQSGKYDGFDAIAADIQQMIANSAKFNGDASPITESAKKLGRMWHSAVTKKRKEDAKKASGSGSDEPPAKRLKLV